ncbi:MAG: hypothetical protein OEW04_12435 [Nitrospirota bacterium]|nr:hypothetical protein [Nitrospirota bacterium]
MLSFSKKYHEDIRAGKITMSFRDWKTLNVQKNKIYKSSSLGLLKILDVSFRKLSDISPGELKKAGFRGVQEFRDNFEDSARRAVNFKEESAVKIEFEYLGEDIENRKRLMGKVTPMELFEIRQNILALEEKSGSLWVVKTLEALEKQGPQKIEDLERSLKMPPDMIKVNLRRLRGLSLISSKSKRGYSITPLSLKILGILRKK